MPLIEGHQDLFRDWDGLIAAVLQNADRMPGYEQFTTVLQDFLAEAKAAKAEQEQQEGLRKATTQKLDFLLDRGKEAARKVRRFVLLHYDSRDKQLTQFGITPFETRVRRTATIPKKPTPPLPGPEAQKPAQETASAPPPAGETNPPSDAAGKAE